MRYTILTGTDWRGDAIFYVYDNHVRITVGPVLHTRASAHSYIATLTQ